MVNILTKRALFGAKMEIPDIKKTSLQTQAPGRSRKVTM